MTDIVKRIWISGIGWVLMCACSTITANASFKVHYLSVGQADSALIECDGHYAMIDCGNDSIIENGFSSLKIDYYLQQENIDDFDFIVCSHYDTDHYAGFSDILRDRDFDKVYGPSGAEKITTREMVAFNNLLKNKKAKIKIPEKGDTFSLGEAQIEILAVDSGSSKNDSSIVLMITYGNTKFLFPGDAERMTENALVKSGVALSCDVLKVAHHGSDTSTSANFLSRVKPEYAILSVAAYRDLPNDTVLANLEEVSAEIYRTDEEGTIICESDGTTIKITNGDGEQIN